MKKKKKSIYFLFVFLLYGFVISQIVSKIIDINEYKRELNDIRKLEAIRYTIEEAVESSEDAKKRLISFLGGKDYNKIYIGSSSGFNYNVIKDYYQPIYNAIKDYSLNDSEFESLLSRKGNYNIKFCADSDCNIEIKMEDKNGNQVKCNHIDLYMSSYRFVD